MARGFVYLVAIVNWLSRKVLSLAALDHAVGGLLYRGSGGGARPAWQAGDLQHRSGQSVQLDRLHQGAEDRRNRDQHGRQGRLARQCLRRAALADGQYRGGLPPSLHRRHASPRFNRITGLRLRAFRALPTFRDRSCFFARCLSQTQLGAFPELSEGCGERQHCCFLSRTILDRRILPPLRFGSMSFRRRRCFNCQLAVAGFGRPELVPPTTVTGEHRGPQRLRTATE